jgi:hypothetical protein
MQRETAQVEDIHKAKRIEVYMDGGCRCSSKETFVMKA